MKDQPSETVIAAWTGLMRAQQSTLSRIEAALKAAALPPLSWYDALLELERAGREGIRPFALEDRLLLRQYSLSRLLDRIEAAGYLERRPCKEDGRGQVVVITKEGRALRRRMWPVYAKAIDRAIAQQLTEAEAANLRDLLGKLSGPSD